jgi:hypothetical protein
MIKRVEGLWGDRQDDPVVALHEKYFDTATKWTTIREQMTANRVPPLPLRS